ncbi:MAG TPA: ABC transporter substrate-binding protein/permease [Polyangiaceae bacterium]|nr:ABC transporter substrate-binding protein/permease [Polyangiaceae bacterium]
MSRADRSSNLARWALRWAVALMVVWALVALRERTARADLKPLVWAADQEGGGPYVYPSDEDPGRVVGFEVELAERFAAHLARQASFYQGQWDKLPDLLRAKKCDIVLNGYEWSAARADAMEASIPYYAYALQLLARKGGELRSWVDLSTPSSPPRKVGVLGGSAAEAYLRQRLGERVEIVSYDGTTDAMREVETGKLDATLQDTPAAAFYGTRFPLLEKVEAPVGGGFFVVYAAKGQTALVHALSEKIALMVRDGELEALYRKYGIWNDAQGRVREIAEAGTYYGLSLDTPGVAKGPLASPASAVSASARKHGLGVVAAYGWILVRSAGLTLLLSCLSFPLAVAVGLLIALGRLYGPRWVKAPLAAYVEFLRGTPVMLQLYFIFFFLPEVGINVPAFWTAIAGLAINYSAYESEIYRAGLLAVPKGQMEAALALGMSQPLALRRIIVPQAVRMVIPPVVNDFIALFKDTSVCSVVTLVELTKRFSVLSQSTQATAELMLMTAVLYLAMSYPLSLLSRRLELSFGRALS